MKSILLFIIATLLCTGIYAKDNGKNKRPVMAKTQGTQIVTARMNINNLNALEANNGYSDYNTNSNLEGTEYPKGTGKTAVFQSGFLWGGFISGDSQVRVGGSAYRSGLQPGPIINGVAADPTDTKYSIYRVRPDVYPGGPAVDLSSDALLEGVSESALRAQYESDWTNWPAAGTANNLGAPFKDVNGDGIYEPGTDIPGVPGADQTIYYVANDLNSSLTTNLCGTQPIGLEVHATFWAYNRGGTLNNVYFKKYTLINKGGNTIDSMFVSLWADADLGTATDDLAGSDSTLNMIYSYNGEATDAVYSPDIPPSVGFSLLEGPMVKGNSTDTALFNGSKISGKKNLPMTAAYFFINGDVNYNDPVFGDPAGASEFYHFFNGQYGSSGLPFIDNNVNVTKFVFNGDPVQQTGWIDGVTSVPGDRRQGMASGPFTMAPGDTQEVVFAEIFGVGKDYLHSVYTVKEYKYNAAVALNNSVNVIKVPPAPAITFSNDNNAFQLQWDNGAESFNQSGYSFEGYNVYQLSSPYDSKEDATLIATYDKADGIKTIYGQALNPKTDQVYNQIQQSGNDSGLQYSITLNSDYINNTSFIKGKKYYYAVTSYAYCTISNSIPTNTESAFQPVSVAYNHVLPGVNYGDTVLVTHLKGKSDCKVIVVISDPSKLVNHKYQITFNTSACWSLKDLNTNAILFSDLPLNYYTMDTAGFSINVTNAKAGMNAGAQGVGWDVPSGYRRFTWGTTSLLTAYALEGFDGAIGWASPDYLYNSGIESVPASSLCNTLLTLAQVTDTSYFDPVFPSTSDVNLSYGYRYLRYASQAAADTKFASHIINTTGGTYPFQDFAQTVPLSAWNVDDPTHPSRLALGYLENNAAGGLVDGKYWPPDYTQFDQADTREFLWIFQAPYSTTANANYEIDALNSTTPLPVMWFCILSRRMGAQFSPNGTGTDQFLINCVRQATSDDIYTFDPSIITDVKTTNVVTKYSLSQNYPNPFNPSTRIDFTLPKTEHVILKVYDILGRQVATLVNGSRKAGSYSLEFNAGKFASGVYIYRIQAGSFTETKKLLLLK